MVTDTLNKRFLFIVRCQYKQQWKYFALMHIVEHSYKRYNHFCFLSHSMALITQFDDLPDLFFIDLFNYLSSIDILWAFTNLNNRIQTIINERGFFLHINSSSARLPKFDRLLTILPLNQIGTLIIDIEASPLQLSRWPYLPHLTTLRLYGLRDFIDATKFILRHSTSLIHLTLETNNLFMSVCITQEYFQTNIQVKKNSLKISYLVSSYFHTIIYLISRSFFLH